MRPFLDTLWTPPYIRAPLWAVVALTVGVSPTKAWAEKVAGVELPDGSQKVGENRYKSPDDWEATQKFYKSVYPRDQYPRRPIVNQPGVKAVHIANPSGKVFG